MANKLGCGISDEDKTLLNCLTKEQKTNQAKIISEALRYYAQYLKQENVLSLEAFNLSGSEQLEVENALINSDSQLDVVARDGLLQRSRYLNSVADKQSQFESMSEDEMKNSTFRGVANYRIENAIETIMNHNNNQSEKSRKVCLTKGIVFKLTGSNRQTINKYFDEHEVTISDHNHKHSLTDTNNRKGKGFSFEQLLGME